jgi:monoamine oxidase
LERDQVTSDVDLAIVGAGAAGIGAGLTARSAGLSCRILEAADRIGGRAWTVRAHGVSYDLGCHFLHDASRNPFTLAALASGLPLSLLRKRAEMPEAYFVDGVRRDEATRAAYAAYCRDSLAALETASEDIAADQLMDIASPFYEGFKNWCAAIYGAEPDRVSTRDAANYLDSGEDWPVPSGFGALIAAQAAGLPITTNCPVTAIDTTGKSVTLETAVGRITAAAVLVTVSNGVLRSGAIRFTPALPDAVLAAIDGLPMGIAERVCLVTDGPILDGRSVSSQSVAADGHLIGLWFNEAGTPTIGGYLAGAEAAEIARDGGASALAAYVEEQTVAVLGADIRKRIVGRLSSEWTVNPLTLGAYSIALPGHARDRETLAEPFDARLRLAGEAASSHAYGSAHGAYTSGVTAVGALISEGLGRR